MRPLRSVPSPATAPTAPFATYAIAEDGSSWDVNARFEQLLGYTEASLTAQFASLDELTHPEDRLRVRAEIAAARGIRGQVELEYRLRRADGVYVWVQDEAVLTHGGRTGYLLDITRHVTAVEELQVSEERFRTLLLNIPGAMYRCAARSNWDMEFISDNVEAISGYPASDFIGSRVRTFASVIHPEDRQAVEMGVDEGLRPEGSRSSWSTGSSGPTAASPGCTRRARACSGPTTRCSGSTARSSTSPSASCSRRNFAAGLLRLADRPREPRAVRRPGAARARACRPPWSPAGRAAAGPRRLQDHQRQPRSPGRATRSSWMVAQRIKACCRLGDTVARLGGDEFAVLLEEGVDEEEAKGVAGRLLEILREPFLVKGREMTVGGSIGIAIQRGDRGMHRGPAARRRRRDVLREEPGAGPVRAVRAVDAHAGGAAVRAQHGPAEGAATRGSSSCTTSRSSTSRRRSCRALRRWCAGSTPSEGCWRRTSSSPPPSRAG